MAARYAAGAEVSTGRSSSLVTRDPATGLRYSPTTWTQTGEIPSPDGCRWCGHEQRGHAQMWRPSVGWHKWVQPTDRQRAARMKARRARSLAAEAKTAAQYAEDRLMLDFTLTTATPGDGVALVTVAGDLDVYAAPQLRDALIDQVNLARYRQVIDLSGVRRIDSSGLAVIVGGRARALIYGGALRLIVPDRAENVTHALTVTGLAKAIPVHENAADALAAFETAEITIDTKEAAG